MQHSDGQCEHTLGLLDSFLACCALSDLRFSFVTMSLSQSENNSQSITHQFVFCSLCVFLPACACFLTECFFVPLLDHDHHIVLLCLLMFFFSALFVCLCLTLSISYSTKPGFTRSKRFSSLLKPGRTLFVDVGRTFHSVLPSLAVGQSQLADERVACECEPSSDEIRVAVVFGHRQTRAITSEPCRLAQSHVVCS